MAIEVDKSVDTPPSRNSLRRFRRSAMFVIVSMASYGAVGGCKRFQLDRGQAQWCDRISSVGNCSAQ